jgi:hypothetical protein
MRRDSGYKFEWDARKNETNFFKHDVTFEEASTVFDDDYAVTLYDENHSDDEDRFIIIGVSENALELTVCHCYRSSDSVIRIISARKATKRETSLYWGGLQ